MKIQRYLYDGKNKGKSAPRVHINPLSTHNMNKYFKQKNNMNIETHFQNQFWEIKRELELRQLFEKFDDNASGTIDLDELVTMFHVAGIKI